MNIKDQSTQTFAAIRGLAQHPATVVIGILAGAGAAKLGLGEWAAGGILVTVAIQFGAALARMAVRMPRPAPILRRTR